MPRTARVIEAGLIYHVLSCGNGRLRLFPEEEDFAAFDRVLSEGLDRYRVDLFTGHSCSVTGRMMGAAGSWPTCVL